MNLSLPTKMAKLPSDQQYDAEATLLKKVMEWLEPQGRDGVKAIRICDRYTKGYSDIFICVRGVLVVAELKDNTGTASPQQIQFIKDMQKAGAIGAVCRSVKEVADLVDAAKRRVPEWMQIR